MSSKDRARLNNNTIEWRKRNPWFTPHANALKRCTRVCDRQYSRYGGRGIKMLMTVEDFKTMWLRDGAGSMSNPVIHRIDNMKHYAKDNCCFMERSRHAILHGKICKNQLKRKISVDDLLSEMSK